MIRIENNYKAKAIFSADRSTTWDTERDKSFKVKLFGLTIWSSVQNLHIDYTDNENKNEIGFKKK
jgi:hypothetical protein